MNPPLPDPDLARDRAPAAPGLVLDTNVVLDWLVFDNPSTRAFADAIRSARVRWQVSASLRDELARVLVRGLRAAPGLDAASVWRQWASWSNDTPAPAATAPVLHMRCTDADDQKFIDLAVACGARWLLSRDKAVLKLARPAAAMGLEIITPDRWSC